MRATMKITWLLFSLCLLFCSVCSDDVSQSTTSVTSGPTAVPTAGSASGAQPTTKTTEVAAGSTAPTAIVGDTADQKEPTKAPTTAKSAVVVTQAATEVAVPKLTVKPVATQPSAPTATNKPTAAPTGISITGPTVVTAATPPPSTSGPPATVKPSAKSDSSSSSSVPVLSAATVQTSHASEAGKTSATDAPVKVGTTKIPKISTDASSPEQLVVSTAPTTLSPQTSQQDSKDGKEIITVTVKAQVQTASKAPEPTGNRGTTSTPSTLTKAGSPAAETLGTKAGTTSLQITSIATTATTATTTTTVAQFKNFLYSLNNGQEKEKEHKELVEVCRRLMVNLQDGNCTLTWRRHNDKIQFDCVEINGKVKTSLATQYYEEITMKPGDNKTLIAILASCGALLIMIVILAVCASHHRKPYNENQQHLTEELHTVENGYHDNPTLEVMEVQPEMQEKKMALNGEFNDSWIVPIDNLLKEDVPDEEDTHL